MRCAKCGELILPNQTPWDWGDNKYYHLECQPSYDSSKQTINEVKE